ncbi:MAG: transposase [Candidatus Cloacimonadales bacterium]
MNKNNKFNSEIHHRRSIRLPGYDYSQEGFYFITLCTQNHKHLFGEINDGVMKLNRAGLAIKEEWENTSKIRKNIILGEYVIMPNHFHAIVQIEYPIKPQSNDIVKLKSPSQTIGSIIRGFKGATIKYFKTDILSLPSIWQRNYWEHIIRTELEFGKISQYIIGNPACWEDDKLNGGRGNEVLENQEGYNDEIWMV